MVSGQRLDIGRDLVEDGRIVPLPALGRDLDAPGGQRPGQLEVTQAGMHVGKGVGDPHLDRPDRRVRGRGCRRTIGWRPPPASVPSRSRWTSPWTIDVSSQCDPARRACSSARAWATSSPAAFPSFHEASPRSLQARAQPPVVAGALEDRGALVGDPSIVARREVVGSDRRGIAGCGHRRSLAHHRLPPARSSASAKRPSRRRIARSRRARDQGRAGSRGGPGRPGPAASRRGRTGSPSPRCRTSRAPVRRRRSAAARPDGRAHVPVRRPAPAPRDSGTPAPGGSR